MLFRSPDTLRAKANLALSRKALSEPGAERDLDQVVNRLEASIGREHPSVVSLRAGTRILRVIDPQPF